MLDVLCFFVSLMFLSLLIVPCLKASQAVSHLSSTLFGAIIAFSNVLRMKLLGKAVSFDSLSYSLISFHMLTYFHMLLGFFFDFICVANALGCWIWIAWYHQKVCHFKCEQSLMMFLYALKCSYMRLYMLPCAFCFALVRFFVFLCAFIRFWMLSYILYAFECFHRLSYAFIRFHTLSYALICFYMLFEAVKS